jgi:isocitrate dehydrogenase
MVLLLRIRRERRPCSRPRYRPAIEKGIETFIVDKTVIYGFARLMRAEGGKDVKEVERSEFSDAIIANM